MIFHDAVRPLLSDKIITDVIQALVHYQAVDVAIESADTIIEVDHENIIKKIPLRKNLRRGQTPQGFRLSVIKKAYEKALKDPEFKTTDDCGVVLKYLPEVKIYVVNGEGVNMKLTYKEDFFLLKALQLNLRLWEQRVDRQRKQTLVQKVVVVFGFHRV